MAAVGRSGWIDQRGSTGVFLTLTALGADRLPWDLSACSHGPGVECAGSIGCVCEPMALAAWHDALPMAWSHFMTELRRQLPGVAVEFFKSYEPQLRGALHIHAMLRVVGVVSRRRFEAAVRLARARNGFGRQLRLEWIDLASTDASEFVLDHRGDAVASVSFDPVARSAARTAGYVAKYASKNADHLPTVLRLDTTTGELRCGGFRAWSSSRLWGESMAAVQRRRRVWAQGAGAFPSAEDGPAPAPEAPLTCTSESTQPGGVPSVCGASPMLSAG